MTQPTIFIVTDIEADGPDPGRHSMLSIGSVALGEDGRDHGGFTVNLAPLPGAEQDAGSMAWWRLHPQAWQSTSSDPQEPASAIASWVEWVRSLPGTPVFAAHPISFDGAWMDWYLQRFTGRRLYDRPRDPGLCHGYGLDIPSLVMAATGWNYRRCDREHYPDHWLGEHTHSHCALDDARGYAHLLGLALGGQLLEPVRGP
jgi:hypothetical protein